MLTKTFRLAKSVSAYRIQHFCPHSTSDPPLAGHLLPGRRFCACGAYYTKRSFIIAPILAAEAVPIGGIGMGEQKLSLEDRSRLLVTGVSQVLRFEEELVVLETNLGMLHVHGRELKLQDLSLEGSRAAVAGQVSALIFEEPRERSLLGRLLR